MSAAAAAETCVFHPDRPAAGHCSNCNQPICLGCQMTVAGKNVCQRCVAAIRAQVAGQMPQPGAYAPPQPAAPPAAYGQPGAYAPPPPPQLGGASVAYQPPYQTAVAGPPAGVTAGNYFGGIGLGFLAGLVGTGAWVALVYAIHFNITLLAIGVGFLIGIAVVKGAGNKGGQGLGIVSALLALIFLGVGALLTSSTFFGILCVVLGVLQAYRTPANYG